jgi:hypothetical protein
MLEEAIKPHMGWTDWQQMKTSLTHRSMAKQVLLKQT